MVDPVLSGSSVPRSLFDAVAFSGDAYYVAVLRRAANECLPLLRDFSANPTGLELVEAILQHIGYDSGDPFTQRPTTGTGNAASIRTARAQPIDIIHPGGNGFVNMPALAPFILVFCRLSMREDLFLDHHPAWWCDTADGLYPVSAFPGQSTVVPDMPASRYPYLGYRIPIRVQLRYCIRSGIKPDALWMLEIFCETIYP